MGVKFLLKKKAIQGTYMFKEKQMIRELFIILATILFAVLVSVGLLSLNRSEGKQQLKRMMEHNACAGNIYADLIGMEESLRSIQESGEEEQLERYREHVGHLHENLQIIEEYAAADQSIHENVRKIQEFYNYQDGILKQEHSRSTIVQLQEFMPEQISSAKVVVVQTLADSTRVYTEAMRLIDRTQLTVWGCIVAILVSGMMMIAGRLGRVMEALEENRRVAEALTAHEWDAEDVKLGAYSDLNKLSAAMNQMKHEIAGYARRLDPREKR